MSTRRDDEEHSRGRAHAVEPGAIGGKDVPWSRSARTERDARDSRRVTNRERRRSQVVRPGRDGPAVAHDETEARPAAQHACIQRGVGEPEGVANRACRDSAAHERQAKLVATAAWKGRKRHWPLRVTRLRLVRAAGHDAVERENGGGYESHRGCGQQPSPPLPRARLADQRFELVG